MDPAVRFGTIFRINVINAFCKWSPQASDVRAKESPEFCAGTDNPAFTDIVMSKDAETVTKF